MSELPPLALPAPPPPTLHDLLSALQRAAAATQTLVCRCRSADGQVVADRAAVERRLRAALAEVQACLAAAPSSG